MPNPKPTPAKPSKPSQAVVPTHVTVTFKIVTPDQKRRIVFTLTKNTDKKSESWSVMFELDERADVKKDFQMVIQLQVDVAKGDAAKAASTAKHGLDTDQEAQALAAADVAKDAKKGDATVDEAKEEAAAVVSARSEDSPS